MTLSQASFDYIRTVLRQRSGQNLEDDKIYLVETRLNSVARRHGFPSVEDLVQSLRSRKSERLLSEAVEAMTINETFFFRDGPPFEALRQSVLPALIQQRAGSRSLTIWSAACSSGQEPYSVAMLVRHGFPALAGWTIRVMASDLSERMLDRARRGRYSDLEVSRGLPPDLLKAHFQKQEDGWQVRDEIRRMVEFLPINLIGTWPELPPCDLILLRNVLIYFDVPTRKKILEGIRRVLRPDGFLLLGGAETTHNLDDGFVSVSFGQASFFKPRPLSPEAI